MKTAEHPASRAAVSREFSRIPAGPYQLYLRADLVPHAAALAMALHGLGAANSTDDSNSGAGNRRGGFRVSLPGIAELFVRRSRRGGAMRLFVDDLYFGFRPRPLAELWVAAEQRAAAAVLDQVGILRINVSVVNTIAAIAVGNDRIGQIPHEIIVYSAAAGGGRVVGEGAVLHRQRIVVVNAAAEAGHVV